MSAPLNAQLIDAVEAGRAADVTRLIEAGASPDARKRVTLRFKVENGRGGFDWKEDSVDCESALALAILHAQGASVVRALLAKGASVNGDVEWKLCYWWNSGRHCTANEWQHKRWLSTFRFSSPLCLAIGRGGNQTRWDGDTSVRPDSDGNLWINLRGGAVRLTHPTSWEARSVKFTVCPDIELVRLLLAHGACVTDVELNAARQNPNPNLLPTLELHSHQRSTIPPVPPPKPCSPLELANAALVAQVRNLTARVTAAESRVSLEEDKARIAESKLAVAEKTTASLQALNTALDQEITTLRTRTTTLEEDNASLRMDVPSLRRETTSLRQEIVSLRNENAFLRTHNATLLAENISLRSLSAPPPHPRPPTSVRRMMFAIGDYEPQDDDEIGFVVGDALFVNLQYADGWGHVSTPNTNSQRFLLHAQANTPTILRASTQPQPQPVTSRSPTSRWTRLRLAHSHRPPRPHHPRPPASTHSPNLTRSMHAQPLRPCPASETSQDPRAVAGLAAGVAGSAEIGLVQEQEQGSTLSGVLAQVGGTGVETVVFQEAGGSGAVSGER
ncbi:hypothetical protein M427DRAFT_148168 [Gonapodya prolifera JEL478]|uniref:SH3 domain-containing protein n=1 Tax=Gonapodya prolifera (strain JEL478) TaxID=1344416 RepID=A0A139A2S5_GONPJ|nr:hypothetical protein M427DRAFT_148168 [Gonapodya prolifera JEL478]|eukprot:KXS11051.1 hypothetical protein M427DRAFT_148168 [Gonapodya prolifera JEL478]